MNLAKTANPQADAPSPTCRVTWMPGLAPDRTIQYRLPDSVDATDPVSRVALARAGTDALSQLRPSLSQLDRPDTLPGIARAVARLAKAIETGERIAIVSDHDVDGCTGHAVLLQALTGLFGVDHTRLDSFIGIRLTEGYGLSAGVLDRILASPALPAVLITVDCGSSDEARIRVLAERGVDVIVTDHHALPVEGPPASALATVSPARTDSAYPDTTIAGVMVAWLLMAALAKRLQGSSKGLASLLDYVALGTVADCVDLGRSVNNRAVVRYGLKLIEDRARPCWEAIADYLGDAPGLTSRDLAFGIGPRLNARGRLDEAMAGVRFLTASDLQEATPLAALLDDENSRRKTIEHKMVDQAVGMADRQVENEINGLVIWMPDGHTGVHGIVASRIVERHGRPVVCLSPQQGDGSIGSRDGPGRARLPHPCSRPVPASMQATLGAEAEIAGSVRSVEGIHIRDGLQTMADRHPDLMVKFGGHAMAAGLTIKRCDIERFTEGFDRVVSDALDGRVLSPVIWSDGDIDPSMIDPDFIDRLNQMEPYGRGFEDVVFEADFTVGRCRAVGGDKTHLSLTLVANRKRFGAIWFNALPDGNTDTLPEEGQSLRLCFTPDINWWNGEKRIQIRVIGVVS